MIITVVALVGTAGGRFIAAFIISVSLRPLRRVAGTRHSKSPEYRWIAEGCARAVQYPTTEPAHRSWSGSGGDQPHARALLPRSPPDIQRMPRSAASRCRRKPRTANAASIRGYARPNPTLRRSAARRCRRYALQRESDQSVTRRTSSPTPTARLVLSRPIRNSNRWICLLVVTWRQRCPRPLTTTGI